MRIIPLLCAAGCVVLAAAACDTPSAAGGVCARSSLPSSAVMTIAWRSRPDTLRVLVHRAETVQAACGYIAGRTLAGIPSGEIERGAGVDPRVPFHYLPETVRLVEVAMELCDSRLLRTPEEVDAYIRGATGSADADRAPFCPWNAYPIRVDPA